MLNMIAPFEMGICVNNLETMITFYRDVLGLTLISEIDVPSDKSSEAGAKNHKFKGLKLVLKVYLKKKFQRLEKNILKVVLF